MRDKVVRRLEMSNRVVGFFNANPIPYRKGSPGPQLVDQFKKAVAGVEDLAAAQAVEFTQARNQSGARGEARQALIDALDQIVGTSRGMMATVPGLEDKFQPARGLGDSKLLTQARSIVENATPFEKDFVNFEMAPDFLDDLNSKIEGFKQAVANHTASRSAHVATSQLVDDAMQQAMNILVQLDPIVKNKLRGNPALTLKWENVRHTERAWVSKKTTQPKPAADLPAVAA